MHHVNIDPRYISPTQREVIKGRAPAGLRVFSCGKIFDIPSSCVKKDGTLKKGVSNALEKGDMDSLKKKGVEVTAA